MENKTITFDDILKANESIKTTTLKNEKTGRVIGDYAEVNQRVKAFRMLYPQGTIETDMISNENGICIFRAKIYNEEGKLLATGTAYEKEGSTFINKTSYIENCETSAIGRALGMAGLGIDTSIASAEEVMNAVTNQNNTSSSKGNTSPQTNKKLSEAQLKRLYAISNVAGYSNEKLAALVRAKYNCDVAELTKEQYDYICESLEKAKK